MMNEEEHSSTQDNSSTEEHSSTQNYGRDLAQNNGREVLGGGVETYSYVRLEDIRTINVWTLNDGTHDNHDGTHNDHDGTWSQYPHKVEKDTNQKPNITSKPIGDQESNTGGDSFEES